MRPSTKPISACSSRLRSRVGNRVSRFAGDREHVRREHVIAVAHDRPVLDEPVAIEIVGQRSHQRIPPRAIAQSDGGGGALLEAAVRIREQPIAHARQFAGELRLHLHVDAAAPGNGIGGTLHGNRLRLRELQDRRLVRALRHGRHHFLRDLQCVGRRIGAIAIRGLDVPREARRRLRHGDVPDELACLAGRELGALRRQVPHRSSWRRA